MNGRKRGREILRMDVTSSQISLRLFVFFAFVGALCFL
jgi:hypothetical protein